MDEQSYTIYKGLQKPLEFMGLRGRYIIWAAIGALTGLLVFAICFFLFSFGVAILSLFAVLSTCIGSIAVKQRRGLHSKNILKGTHITTHIFKV